MGAASGAVIGRIDGQVIIDQESKRLWGVLALIVSTPLGAVIAFAVGPPSIRAGVVGALVLLVAPLLLVVALAWALGGRGMAVGAATRSLSMAASSASRAGSGAAGGPMTITVRRFRVRRTTGGTVACQLLGDVVGDEIRHGDIVRLDGRPGRDGSVRAASLDVLETPAGPVISTVRTRGRLGVLGVVDKICWVIGVGNLVLILGVVALATLFP